jgi:hypothetical protein
MVVEWTAALSPDPALRVLRKLRCPLVRRPAPLRRRVPAAEVELLITREWAILAGENDYITGTFQQITGRPPRPVTEFLHEHRAEFA